MGIGELEAGMKRVIGSAMETMHILGASVPQIKAEVERLMTLYDIKEIKPLEEPHPLRAFPDHFYSRPATVAEEPPPVRLITTSSPQWIPHRPKSVVEYPGQWCACGHRWEHHAPACVHYIEGCACEEFMRVPTGTMEGA